MSSSAICFGEILFDIFGDERSIGGAPFNFAVHFARLGGMSAMVSALGDDELGLLAREYLKDFGVSDEHIATVNLPTGTCNVTLCDGIPWYDLKENVSYDKIPVPRIKHSYDMLYIGSLAQRSEDSRIALDSLLRTHVAREVFFDINIREKGCSQSRVTELLDYTTVLKFSREEAGALGKGELTDLCRSLADWHRNIKLIIVTLDCDGAFVYDTQRDVFRFSRRPRTTVVSTVGAGDSFSARFMYDYLRGTPIDTCIENAIRLSEKICAQKGAI